MAHQASSHHVPAVSHYVGVFLALMVLTTATVGVASFDLGPLNTIVAMIVAGIKAFLVMYIFMELRNASSLTRLSALSGIVFLAIMLIMIGQDYAARSYMPYPTNWGKTLPVDMPHAAAPAPAAGATHAPAPAKPAH